MITLLALHRHFLAADALKQVIFAKVDTPNSKMPADVIETAQLYSSVLRMQVFYALMYVVIEGYRELKCEDSVVDELLRNEAMVELFRRFRNAIFHFQKDPFSSKLEEFLGSEGSEVWARELHAAFRSYFPKVLPIKEFTEQLKRTDS